MACHLKCFKFSSAIKMRIMWTALGYLLLSHVVATHCNSYFELYVSDAERGFNSICRILTTPTKLDANTFRRNDCTDYNKAVAIKLCYATKGTSITLYESQQFTTDNDYAKITVQENMSGCKFIDTFERSDEIGELSIIFTSIRGKKLGGKIGSVEITGNFQLIQIFHRTLDI